MAIDSIDSNGLLPVGVSEMKRLAAARAKNFTRILMNPLKMSLRGLFVGILCVHGNSCLVKSLCHLEEIIINDPQIRSFNKNPLMFPMVFADKGR